MAADPGRHRRAVRATVGAIVQFLLTSDSISVTVGAMDGSIREMRKTARALTSTTATSSPTDNWRLQISDVCGKGPATAGRALLARYTLRTAALLDGDPYACCSR